MAKNILPDWNDYWSKISSLNMLVEKSNDLDDTLRNIEKEFDCKLLSGDHIQIITALEERIEELTNSRSLTKEGVQADLFD